MHALHGSLIIATVARCFSNPRVAAIAVALKVTNQGVIAFGIPLGNEIYTKTMLEEKAEKFQKNLMKCAEMCTKQVTLAIIQNTASAYQHIVAVLPPDETQWFGKRIDNINAKVLRNHIFATSDYEFTDDEWKTIMARVKMQLRIGGLGVLSLEDRALMAFVGTQFQIRSAQDNKSKKVVMWWDKTSMSDMQHSAAKEVAEIHLGNIQDNCVYDDAAITEAISWISKKCQCES